MSDGLKVHNTAGSAKIRIRASVLAAIGGAAQARVLDCYCGPTGHMWENVYREVALYEGIDRVYKWGDQRRRYIGETVTTLRAIDLERFNVFDIDAFGSPWEAVEVILKRRPFDGSAVAFVLTDGSFLKTRFGGVGGAVTRLLDGTVSSGGMAPTTSFAEVLREALVARLIMGVGQTKRAHWHAKGRGSGLGGAVMHYDGIVLGGNER